MANYYVDFSAGTNGTGTAASPWNVFTSTQSAGVTVGDRVWFRRYVIAADTKFIAWKAGTDTLNRITYIGWPIAGDEYYDIREETLRATWDGDAAQYAYQRRLTYVRRALREENSFDAVVEVKIPYKLFQVFTKNNFVYAAVQKGIEIFDLNTTNSLYIKEVPNTRITTIWGNDTTLFFGGIGGLFYIDYENLHADYENSTISGSFQLKSPIVKYIHGKDKELLVTTTSGVEYFNWSNNPTIKSNTYIENAGKCFLAENAAYYFTNTTISGEPYWTLNKKQNLITDWEYPTKTFNTGDTFTLSTALTDIYVTNNTTTSGNNTIFCATTSGIYVIDEDENKKVIYYTRS